MTTAQTATYNAMVAEFGGPPNWYSGMSMDPIATITANPDVPDGQFGATDEKGALIQTWPTVDPSA